MSVMTGAERTRLWRQRQRGRSRRIVLRVEVYETDFVDDLCARGRLSDTEIPSRQKLEHEAELILNRGSKDSVTRHEKRGANLRMVNVTTENAGHVSSGSRGTDGK